MLGTNKKKKLTTKPNRFFFVEVPSLTEPKMSNDAKSTLEGRSSGSAWLAAWLASRARGGAAGRAAGN